MGRRRRDERHAVAAAVAWRHGGVATQVLLRTAGLTGRDIRTEVDAGRWQRLGRHTVGVLTPEPTGEGAWWWAVWESGPGAVLDGVTALQASGLTGWQDERIHVSVPCQSRAHRLPGVVLRRPRRVPPTMPVGVPRIRPEHAAVRAAQWAVSDRQAATVLAMTVQQRLVLPQRLLDAWGHVRRARRRRFLHQVLRDVCDGAQSLGELDFAALCRARGLPEPTRQRVRHGPRGRVYLDVYWEELSVHVEIDGAHHGLGLTPVDDALRQNSVALDGGVCLRIPVLGLRLYPDAFLDQVARALAGSGAPHHGAMQARRYRAPPASRRNGR